jgi:predicted nucleic acid-binding Zn finger protein
MKITKNWLTTNATDTSYSRGRGYESSVRKLKKEGDTYTAKVDGSETYKVEITESTTGIQTYCSCPYDHGGICKHIVAVGLNIISGNFKEVKVTEIVEILTPSLQNEEPIDVTTFYQKEFKKAKKDKQEAFIKLLFAQDAVLCRRFLTYIRPPAKPLSTTTDIGELSNEIAMRIMEIDTDEYLSDADEDEGYGRGRGGYGRYDYDDYDEDYEEYDTDALEAEVLRLLQPYSDRVLKSLVQGHFLDSLRIILGIYESASLVEDPELNDYSDFSYIDAIEAFFKEKASEWMIKIQEKTIKKSDYTDMLKLILERWQTFKRFHNKETLAPYEFLNEELFYFIVQKAQSEELFFDLMTVNNLHTADHYELTKKLCIALGKDDFLLEQLAKYALDSVALAKELMEKYIARDNRNGFVAIAQKASEKFNWEVNEFIAERILPTDNLGFFKKIMSETATRKQRLDLFHRWREHVTPLEQENYIQAHNTPNGSFYITLLADAKRFSDVLIFAERNIEKFSSGIFSQAAELVLNIYPDDVFSLYCDRVIIYMGKGGQGRDHYQQAIAMLKPVKNIKGKEAEIKVLAAELRGKFRHLPAFLDELKKGGF